MKICRIPYLYYIKLSSKTNKISVRILKNQNTPKCVKMNFEMSTAMCNNRNNYEMNL